MITKGIKCFVALLMLMIQNLDYYKKVELNEIDNVKYVEVEKADYLAYLKIPRINLNRPLYAIGDIRNDIDSNIIFIDDSDLPNQKNGNVVIAGHSGSSTVSYFKYLYKLEVGDIVYLEYDDSVYQYQIDKRYLVKKTGKVDIVKDSNKETLTLVTCYGKTKQLVLVANLLKQTKK